MPGTSVKVQSGYLESYASQIQPMEDHAASAGMNTSAAVEQSDVQMNAESVIQ